MKPTIQVVRAIGAEFLRRKLRPFVIIGVCVALLLAAPGVWLVTVDIWWWLLLVPIIVLVFVFAVLATAALVVLRLIDSVQTREQKRAVRGYVDAMERVTENIQTPWPVILFQVARDVLWPSREGFIAGMSRDSKTLAPGFAALLRLFE